MSTPYQDQRRQAREQGRFAKMIACPRCGKRHALEPAYSTNDGGHLKPSSHWVGQFLCLACIKAES